MPLQYLLLSQILNILQSAGMMTADFLEWKINLFSVYGLVRWNPPFPYHTIFDMLQGYTAAFIAFLFIL